MVLSTPEIRDLAAFCARRFPAPADRARLAAVAEIDAPVSGDAVEDWTLLLGDAQRQERLGVLATALAAAAPGDANLQAACAELTGAVHPTARLPSFARGTALGVPGLLAAIAVGWWMQQNDTQPAPRVAAAPSTAARAVPATPAVTEAPPPTVGPPTPLVAPPPAPAAAPVAVAPVVVPSPTVAALSTDSAPSASTTTPHGSDCAGTAGEVAGWWYAGTTSPGNVGATFTLDRDARVRADYPRAENGHDSRAPERCVLPRGSSVRLSHEPVNASGTHWWVPYAPGDRVN